ncbi:MAG TPA: glycosyltransferase [Candidatus Nanopelagicaceae bacterium]|nr:glycosyltransferase [Candidatus Nanopelagicaceae bacterium]
MPRRRSAPSPTPIELSVVVPTRDEAGNVPLLLQRLRTSLAEISFEILFVDDSDDATPQLLREIAGKDGRVRVLHRPPNGRAGGLSTAVVLGLAEARGRVVCVMDGDLQHPPEAIPELLAAERAGADVVVASRYLSGGSREGLGGGFRRLVSRGATLLAQAIFTEARTSTDPLAGFFLCRSALLAGLEFRPVGFKILLELLVCSEGATVVDIPLSFQVRGAGKSKATMAQGWLYLRHLWSLVRDVPGSARRWKFAAVGVSGLFLLLAVLELGGAVLGWPALAAWGLAFAVSLGWNFTLNLRLTFADARRERYPLMRRYIGSALTAGGVQLVVFLGLLGLSLPLLLDGLGAAIVGMAVNATLSLQMVRRRRRPPAQPIGLEPLLARLSRASRADLAVLVNDDQQPILVSPAGDYRMTPLVRDLCRRAATTGVPVLWTEPPSSRPQARTNVELTSMIVLPMTPQRPAPLKAVLHRHSRTAFSPQDMEAAMRQLQRLGRFGEIKSSPRGRVRPEVLANPAR